MSSVVKIKSISIKSQDLLLDGTFLYVWSSYDDNKY